MSCFLFAIKNVTSFWGYIVHTISWDSPQYHKGTLWKAFSSFLSNWWLSGSFPWWWATTVRFLLRCCKNLPLQHRMLFEKLYVTSNKYENGCNKVDMQLISEWYYKGWAMRIFSWYSEYSIFNFCLRTVMLTKTNIKWKEAWYCHKDTR